MPVIKTRSVLKHEHYKEEFIQNKSMGKLVKHTVSGKL